MRTKLIILILTIVFISCNNHKYDKQMPTDFSFKIINTTNSYDSKTSIYIRRYLYKDSIVKVSMTQKEMNIIYELFKRNDFLSFPDNFECSIFGTKTLPAFDTTIEITYKGVIKRVKSTTYCEKKKEQRKSDRFDEFSSEINKIINNKTEVKNMRDCDIVFL